MAFDPDAYLSEPFDPDAYLAEAPKREPGANRWVQKMGEGLIPGYSRLVAAGQAALGRGGYSENLRALDEQSKATQGEHPWASALLQTAGAIPSGAMLSGRAAQAGARALEGVPRLARALRGAKEGAGAGAMYGAGGAPADADVGTIASHTVGGGLLGGAIGGAAGALLPSHVPNQAVLRQAELAAREAPTTLTLQRPNVLRRAVDARVKPTKEAETLMAEGVPLTAGLQNPRSAVGQIETASQSLRYTGPAITSQRDAARKATQGAILNKVLPPGMKPQRWAGEVDEALDSIYQGFGKAYESVKGQDIYPAIHADGTRVWLGGKTGTPLQSYGKSVGAFDKILSDKGIMATPETRQMVRSFLENELGMLPQRKGAVGAVPIDRMLAMRSNIRTQIRNTLKGNSTREDHAAAEFLKRAEQAVTEAIESQVDESTAAALKAIDSQYRNYKILESAVAKAGDGSLGFNGRQLTQALRESTSQGEFARGGGGDLRQLARAYQRTFDESMSPPTGARLLTVGPLGEWVTGPLMFSMNRPAAPKGKLPAKAMTLDAETALPALIQMLRQRALPVSADADEE